MKTSKLEEIINSETAFESLRRIEPGWSSGGTVRVYGQEMT